MPRRNLFRGVVGTGIAAANVVLFGEMLSADSVDATTQPRVYTRAEWGALPPTEPIRVLDRAPDHIVVHHTASPNVTDMSLGQAFKLSRQIQRLHMQSNGWKDIGEQLTISRGGYVMEGRSHSLSTIHEGRLVVGAQTLHHNEHTIGIENEGTYLTAAVPSKLFQSLVGVCVWVCIAYELDPSSAIVGHRDYNRTDCPGDVLYGWLPELRRTVARILNLPGRSVFSWTPGGRSSYAAFDHGPAGDATER